jgi:hypothetical protein
LCPVATSALKIIRHSLAPTSIIYLSFLILGNICLYLLYVPGPYLCFPSIRSDCRFTNLKKVTLSSHFVSVPAIPGITRCETHYPTQTNTPYLSRNHTLIFRTWFSRRLLSNTTFIHAKPTARFRGISCKVPPVGTFGPSKRREITSEIYFWISSNSRTQTAESCLAGCRLNLRIQPVEPSYWELYPDEFRLTPLHLHYTPVSSYRFSTSELHTEHQHQYRLHHGRKGQARRRCRLR